MARQARKLSDSGYMHVIVRGIGRQLLFETAEDHTFYLETLKQYSQAVGVTVCAYCLMENHVHLLMYDPEQRIPTLMKKLGIRYSYYFNRKNTTGSALCSGTGTGAKRWRMTVIF